MGLINETSNFDPSVNEIEADDPLTGGTGGNLNLAAQALADRTQYLKEKTDGNHSITDTVEPTGYVGVIDTLLGWLACMIRLITGNPEWFTLPATNLQAASDHINNTSDPHQTLKQVFFVGCVITNTQTAANPNTYLGFGTWVPYAQGQVVVGVGTGYSLGQTGGEATHTLTVPEIPAHSHNVLYDPTWQTGGGSGGIGRPGSATWEATSQTGGGQPHNNMQPFTVAYVWTRTA